MAKTEVAGVRSGVLWDRKRQRAYFKMLSGFVRHRGEHVRFMTLTSPGEAEQVRSLGKAWNSLVTHIRRTTVRQLIEGEWVKPGAVVRFFGDKPLDECLSFEFCKVETREGNGVLHIVCVGDYVPRSWLVYLWKRYRGAWNVDIRLARSVVGDAEGLARYCVFQYCAGQDLFVRCSCSSNWVFPGFMEARKWLENEIDRWTQIRPCRLDWYSIEKALAKQREFMQLVDKFWYWHLEAMVHPVTLGLLTEGAEGVG